MKKTLLLVSACMLASSLAIAPTQARPDFGVRGGAYTDDENPFLGAEALFNIGDTKHWYGNPNVEHAFADQAGDLTSFSFDFHYDFVTNRDYTIWAGAGPTMLHRDRSVGDDNDAGVNAVFGLGAVKGDVRPYGQMKVIVADDTEAVLGVGVRF